MTSNQKPAPKLLEHIGRVFEQMRAEAKSEQVRGKHVLVWEGHTTKLFAQLRMPTPYYSSVLRRLQDMKCIEQLSRGGGSAESRWALLDDPTREAFDSTGPRQGKTRLSLVEKQVSTLQMGQETLMDRIARLEHESGFSTTEMEHETRLAAGD